MCKAVLTKFQGVPFVPIIYFVEHLDELILQQIDPVKKAQLFGVIFDQIPTIEEISCGTPKTPLFPGVNGIFALANMDKDSMVGPDDPNVEHIVAKYHKSEHTT